ncbi:hypothetical protein [Celeribacter baekdonensis]|uniref:Uncharacterized protein n=1 Tax=Celeribacter baekdonensis TaxID=875171 RepID=A0A2R4LZM6_9RHOB|nr:hypothetical protein [Celeribacter baekdonensis]AVW90373.1 hypothetical protein DA792_04115 [Celeribacter baekdonensis]
MDEDNSLNVLENSITASLDLTEMDDKEAARQVDESFELVREDCKNSSIESYRKSAAENLACFREETRV